MFHTEQCPFGLLSLVDLRFLSDELSRDLVEAVDSPAGSGCDPAARSRQERRTDTAARAARDTVGCRQAEVNARNTNQSRPSHVKQITATPQFRLRGEQAVLNARVGRRWIFRRFAVSFMTADSSEFDFGTETVLCLCCQLIRDTTAFA